jgi:hypothetical protein
MSKAILLPFFGIICHLCNDISLEKGLSALAKNLPKWQEFNG